MEYIYAAMLLHRAGKEISEDSLGAVLKAAGTDADSARIKATVAAIKSVNIDEAIKNAVVAAPSAAGAPVKAEAKVEEKPEDKGKTEEEAAAGLGALFG